MELRPPRDATDRRPAATVATITAAAPPLDREGARAVARVDPAPLAPVGAWSEATARADRRPRRPPLDREGASGRSRASDPRATGVGTSSAAWSEAARADRRRPAAVAPITAAAPPLDLAEGAEGEVAAARHRRPTEEKGRGGQCLLIGPPPPRARGEEKEKRVRGTKEERNEIEIERGTEEIRRGEKSRRGMGGRAAFRVQAT